MEPRQPTLEVAIDHAEFNKEYKYFITVQLDGDKEKVLNLFKVQNYFSDELMSQSLQKCLNLRQISFTFQFNIIMHYLMKEFK